MLQTASEWQVVFLITAAVYLIGAVLYGLLASGEKQDWADGDNTVLLNGKEAEYGATNGDPRSPVAAAGGEGKDFLDMNIGQRTTLKNDKTIF